MRVLGFDRRIDRWVPEAAVLGPTKDGVTIVPGYQQPLRRHSSSASAAAAAAAAAAATASPSSPRTTSGQSPEGSFASQNGAVSPVPIVAAVSPAVVGGSGGGGGSRAVKRTRAQTRKAILDNPLQVFPLYDGLGADEAAAEHSKHLRDIKWAEKLVFGDHVIDVWYPSPLPRTLIQEEVTANGGFLYFDEITLKYTGNAGRMLEHKQTHGESMFSLRGPPGICVYEHGDWALWELDGGEGVEYNTELVHHTQEDEISHLRSVEAAHRELYCQNLSVLSKMFLDHKQECFTTSNFLYYVLTERYEREKEKVTGRRFDSRTLRPAVGGVDYLFRGYFSREKGQFDYNLSCIMVLPPFQRLGLGRMLIHFSYLLSGREARRKRGVGAGGPERPLSDLGKRVYLQYWKARTAAFLRAWRRAGAEGGVEDLVAHAHLEHRDAMKAVHALGLLSDAPSPGSTDIDWMHCEECLRDNFVPSSTEAPAISEEHLYHVGIPFGCGDNDDESHEV